MHDIPLITIIAAGLTAAWVLGIIAQRLKLSPIVGYLLAGIIIGPYTPGYAGDQHLAAQIAEIGVILLMFGVGLHFSLDELLSVKKIAIPGAIVQSTVATVLGIVVAHYFGWDIKSGAVFGMAMAVASTVVLIRVLADKHMLETVHGHVAIGWLVVEDILTVIALVFIPTMAGTAVVDSHAVAGGNIWISLGLALGKLLLLLLLMGTLGNWIIPWALVQVAKLKSRELFTLSILVLSIAVATGSALLFGVSMALGAFIAGMVVGRSPVSQQAASDILPMRDAFGVLFFVSVGMLFNPMFILEKPMLILAGLAVIMIAKPLSALFIVVLLGYSPRTALTAAIGLTQIGEFSFILSQLGRQYGLMPDDGHQVLVGCSIISISLNPLLFSQIDKYEAALQRIPWIWKIMTWRAGSQCVEVNEHSKDLVRKESRPHAIIVGYGPIGQTIDGLLERAEIPTVILDMNMDTIQNLSSKGKAAIFGDASKHDILKQAGLGKASHLIVTIPDSTNRSLLVAQARQMNAKVQIIVRVRYLQEIEELRQTGANEFVSEEAEAAVSLARLVLNDIGTGKREIDKEITRLRGELR